MIQISGNSHIFTKQKKISKKIPPTTPEIFLILIFELKQSSKTIPTENC